MKQSSHDAIGLFLAIFHVVTVGLLLTNMLIAMMANTFQAVSENARTEWKFGWAQHIQAAESGASKGTLDRLYKSLAAMDGVRQQEAPSLFDYSEDPGYATVPTSQFLAVDPLTTHQLSNLAKTGPITSS